MKYLRTVSSLGHKTAEAIRRHPLLFALLVVAFALRFSGVFWGLPPFDAKLYHPDEPKIIQGAYRFPWDIASRTDLRYPTACHYTLGALTWPVKKILQSHCHGSFGFGFVYLSGRLLSVALGTLSVFVVYLLGRQSFDRAHGLVAASALAFAMFHVTNSAWATTDVATSFLLSLFLFVSVSACQLHSSRLALVAGVTLGMLVGAKYTGAIAVVPLLVLVGVRHHLGRGLPTRPQVIGFLTDRTLWIVGGSSLLVFFLTTPGILVHPFAFLSSIEYEQARMAQSRLPLYEPRVWSNVFARFSQTMGFPLAASACVGLCIALASRRAFEIAVSALLITFVLYFGNALAPRYVIMIMPVLAILAARALLLPMSAQQQWVRLVGTTVCAGVLLHAFCYSVSAVVSRYPDTRTTAATYIRETVPAGATIGIAYTSPRHAWNHHGWRYPEVDFDRLKYLDFLQQPEFVIVSSYDANAILRALRSGQLQEDDTLPTHLAKNWYERSPPSPEIFRFFRALYFDNHGAYRRVASFAPRRRLAPIEFPPPVIEVFERKKRETRLAEPEN